MMAGHINHVLKVANSFVMMNLCYSKPYHGGRTVLTRSLIKALAVLSLLDALIQLLGRIRSEVHFCNILAQVERSQEFQVRRTMKLVQAKGKKTTFGDD